MTEYERLLSQRPKNNNCCSSALERYLRYNDLNPIDGYIMQKQEIFDSLDGKFVVDRNNYDAFVAHIAKDLNKALKSIK